MVINEDTSAARTVAVLEVRAAGEADLVIADGFSCRVQIVQGTDDEGLHLAEVMRRALDE